MDLISNYLLNVSEEAIEDTVRSTYQGSFINKTFATACTLLAIISICVNILIVTPIIKFNTLRKERRNIILVNFTAFSTLLLLSTIIEVQHDRYWELFDYRHLCFLNQLEILLVLGTILLIMFLTIYWYTQLHHPNIFVKLSNYFKFILGCVYIFLMLWLGLDTDSCYNERLYRFSTLVLFCFIVIYIITNILLNIFHIIKTNRLIDYKNKKNVPVLLTNVYFLCHLPMLILCLTKIIIMSMKIDVYLIIISIFTIILDPVYLFVILYKFDGDYRKFLRYMLSCKNDLEGLKEESVLYDDDNVNLTVNES